MMGHIALIITFRFILFTSASWDKIRFGGTKPTVFGSTFPLDCIRKLEKDITSLVPINEVARADNHNLIARMIFNGQ